MPSLRARAEAAIGSSFISFLILTINIALFVLMAIVEVNNGRGAEAYFQSASSPVLYDFGALLPAAVAGGQWWRLVTFNFLHIGLMHLFFNSSSLYYVGPRVEELYGSQKFISIYMVTGILSGVASCLFGIGGAGASGAIFGLIGLMAAYGYKLGGASGRALMRQMLIWAAFGFVFGAAINANNVAHAGGFIAGACLAFIVKPGAAQTQRAHSGWSALAIVFILILASSFVMAGRNYGTLQNQAREIERRMQHYQALSEQAETFEDFSERAHDAEGAWDESVNLTGHEQDLNEIAQALRSAAAELESAKKIDDESNQIRKRIVDLLNNRATRLETAALDFENDKRTSLPAPTTSEAEEARLIFESYNNWEKSAWEKFRISTGIQ